MQQAEVIPARALCIGLLRFGAGSVVGFDYRPLRSRQPSQLHQ